MKTKLFLLVVLIVLTVSVNAKGKDDNSLKFGVGALIGLPVGDYTNFASLAWGVDVIGEYPIASSFAVTLSAGYLDWSKKSGVTGNTGSIPILAGGKYHFSDKIYGSAQLGISFLTQSGAGSAFTWAPSVGYMISDKFDLSLKYQSATKNSVNMAFLGIRAGYSF